jgi:metal-responsive CopG/Arc/MetJ family transcriptional regulator
MGRPRINAEQMPARFPAGTLDRMDAVLEAGERRADLIRDAVEREIRRRERKAGS